LLALPVLVYTLRLFLCVSVFPLIHTKKRNITHRKKNVNSNTSGFEHNNSGSLNLKIQTKDDMAADESNDVTVPVECRKEMDHNKDHWQIFEMAPRENGYFCTAYFGMQAE
jgi:hypothetical protein